MPKLTGQSEPNRIECLNSYSSVHWKKAPAQMNQTNRIKNWAAYCHLWLFSLLTYRTHLCQSRGVFFWKIYASSPEENLCLCKTKFCHQRNTRKISRIPPLESKWPRTHLLTSPSMRRIIVFLGWSCHDSFHRHDNREEWMESQRVRVAWRWEFVVGTLRLSFKLIFYRSCLLRESSVHYLESGHTLFRMLFATLQVRLGVSG